VIPIRLRRLVLGAACASGIAAGLFFVVSAPTVQAQAPAPAGPKSRQKAYDAQTAAADPDAPGPVQPIPFSHALHAGEY
jgi:hypothetical protein